MNPSPSLRSAEHYTTFHELGLSLTTPGTVVKSHALVEHTDGPAFEELRSPIYNHTPAYAMRLI